MASAAGAEGLPALIELGKRAVSVPITDASGVAGMIQPRAHVDVLFTRPGSMSEAVTTTILEDIVVLAMGRTTEVANTSGTAVSTTPRPTTQAATLLVTPEQARKLELAKNQGKISLALRNPLDHSSAKDQSATTSDQLYAGFHPEANHHPKPARRPRVEPVDREARRKASRSKARHRRLSRR